MIIVPIIGLVLAIIMSILTWYSRPWALAFILFLLPSYQLRFSAFGIPVTVLELLILVFAAVVLVIDWREIVAVMRSMFQHVRNIGLWQWIQTPLGIAMLSVSWILAASIVSLAITPTVEDGLGLWKAYIIEPILFAVAVAWSVRRRSELMPAVIALSTLVSIIGILSVVQYFTGWGVPSPWDVPALRRGVGVYDYPNAVGLFLAPLVSAGIAMFVHRRSFVVDGASGMAMKLVRIFVGMAVVFGMIGVLAARADGAVIAIGAATVMTLFWIPNARLRVFVVLASIVALMIAFALPQTREILLFQDVSGDVRIALWKGTLNLLEHQPLTGSGLAAFPEVYDLYRLPSHVELLQYPHNLFLDFWVELGALGAFWILVMMIYGVIVTIQARVATHGGSMIILSALTSIAVYGLVDVPYFKNDLAVICWLVFIGVFASHMQLNRKDGKGE
jgi:O-antigen ligase